MYVTLRRTARRHDEVRFSSMRLCNVLAQPDPAYSRPFPLYLTRHLTVSKTNAYAMYKLDALDTEAPLAILQPAAPLRHGSRYIVAVSGALGDWGELLPPTPGFLELAEV